MVLTQRLRKEKCFYTTHCPAFLTFLAFCSPYSSSLFNTMYIYAYTYYIYIMYMLRWRCCGMPFGATQTAKVCFNESVSRNLPSAYACTIHRCQRTFQRRPISLLRKASSAVRVVLPSCLNDDLQIRDAQHEKTRTHKIYGRYKKCRSCVFIRLHYTVVYFLHCCLQQKMRHGCRAVPCA
jgi:hypothetical protein